jgi:hypothetical protein
MTTERIQLHSSTGRLVLLTWSVMPIVGFCGMIVAAILVAVRREAVDLPLPSLFFAIPVLALARWARRNSTTVLASAQGLELPTRKRTIPWPSVVDIRLIPILGGVMMTVHRITFNDGTPPLTFYSQGAPERIVQHFRGAAQAT